MGSRRVCLLLFLFGSLFVSGLSSSTKGTATRMVLSLDLSSFVFDHKAHVEEICDQFNSDITQALKLSTDRVRVHRLSVPDGGAQNSEITFDVSPPPVGGDVPVSDRVSSAAVYHLLRATLQIQAPVLFAGEVTRHINEHELLHTEVPVDWCESVSLWLSDCSKSPPAPIVDAFGVVAAAAAPTTLDGEAVDDAADATLDEEADVDAAGSDAAGEVSHDAAETDDEADSDADGVEVTDDAGGKAVDDADDDDADDATGSDLAVEVTDTNAGGEAVDDAADAADDADDAAGSDSAVEVTDANAGGEAVDDAADDDADDAAGSDSAVEVIDANAGAASDTSAAEDTATTDANADAAKVVSTETQEPISADVTTQQGSHSKSYLVGALISGFALAAIGLMALLYRCLRNRPDLHALWKKEVRKDSTYAYEAAPNHEVVSDNEDLGEYSAILRHEDSEGQSDSNFGISDHGVSDRDLP